MVVSVVLLRRSTIRQSLSAFPWGFIFVKKMTKQLFVFSQQRPKAKPSPCRKAWVCSVSGLGWDDRFGIQVLQIMTKLMFSWGARREHQKGDGRQGDGGQLGEDPHPVLGQGREACGEGGKIQFLPKSKQYLGCLVGRVRVQTRRRRLAEVDRRGRSLLSIPPSRHHPPPRRCCLDLVDRDLLLLENSF